MKSKDFDKPPRTNVRPEHIRETIYCRLLNPSLKMFMAYLRSQKTVSGYVCLHGWIESVPRDMVESNKCSAKI
jgi:hypothetical protein